MAEQYHWKHASVSVNFKQNNWTKFLPMAEFAYNNAKNAITGTSHFQLNCMFNPWVSFEENVDVRSKSKSAETL